MKGFQKLIHKKKKILKDRTKKKSDPEVKLFGKGGVLFILPSVLLSILINFKNYKPTSLH